MFKAEKTFLQRIIEAEENEFTNKYVINAIENSVNEDFLDGNVLYRTLFNRSSLQNMLSGSKVITGKSSSQGSSSNKLFASVTDQIVTLPGTYTVKEALEHVLQFKEAAGDHFYGCLLRAEENEEIIINPLHVLTALSVINDTSFSSKKYKVIIYLYKDREELDEYYKTSNASIEKIGENLSGLLHSYINKVNTVTRIVGIEKYRHTNSPMFDIKYQIKKHEDENQNEEHLMVAHQILAKGVIAPYYGASLIRKNTSSGGMHITPMVSCNISSGASISNTVHPYNSVCCGSLNSATLVGLRSQTHANLLSPYNRDIIHPGALAYADSMVEFSLELYRKAEILPPVKEVEKPKEKEFTPVLQTEPENNVVLHGKDNLELGMPVLIQIHGLASEESSLEKVGVIGSGIITLIGDEYAIVKSSDTGDEIRVPYLNYSLITNKGNL